MSCGDRSTSKLIGCVILCDPMKHGLTIFVYVAIVYPPPMSMCGRVVSVGLVSEAKNIAKMITQ